MLHILMHSPFKINFSFFKNMLKKSDELVLLQDGVIGALNQNNTVGILSKKIKIYAVENDIDARGLKNYILEQIILINYNQFVELTVKHSLQMNW